MSGQQIPNLATFRRGGLRGRGRGHSVTDGAGSGIGGGRRNVDHDHIVQNTDNDAATSRLSAVAAGYLEDMFASLLTPSDGLARRLPLMNRGTYVRTTGIDQIVDTFLSTSEGRRQQVISLGAGSDTRYFRLKQKRRQLDVVYHEIDFGANTKRKIARLRSLPVTGTVKTLSGVDLHDADVRISEDGSNLSSHNYYIHALDLRQLSERESPIAGLDTNLPTLVISECCLVYLPPSDADAVLHHLSQLFPPTTPLGIVIYEPIRPHDSFGKVMVRNLMERGIHLQTLEKYADLDKQKSRLQEHGFTGEQNGAEAADIDMIWSRWIDPGEKERVDGLEWMDEVEEFVLLARHYCICWGWRGFSHGSRLWSELSR